MTITAVIFIAEAERENATLVCQCLQHIEDAGYEFDSLVWDWDQLIDMIAAREADVVVYARPEHINAMWLPRFELATPKPAETPAETPATRIPRQGRRPRAVRG